MPQDGPGGSAVPPAPPTSVLVIPRPTAEDAFRSGSPVELTREMLKSKFDMRLSDAAKSLGMSTTSFKQACRKLGLARWPRRLQSRPPRTGASAASIRRADSDDEDYIDKEAPAESRKRRQVPSPPAMQQASHGAHAQALPSLWPAVNGGSKQPKHDMPASRVAGGESCLGSQHTVRGAESHGLASGAGVCARRNAPSASGAQPGRPAFAAPGLPNNMTRGGLPTSCSDQRSVGQTMDVGALSLAMAASASPFNPLPDRVYHVPVRKHECFGPPAGNWPTALSSVLPSAPGSLFQQQHQLMPASLLQSARSPTVLLQQHTAAARLMAPHQESQSPSPSIQALNEQILATKLQIARLQACHHQRTAWTAEEEAGYVQSQSQSATSRTSGGNSTSPTRSSEFEVCACPHIDLRPCSSIASSRDGSDMKRSRGRPKVWRDLRPRVKRKSDTWPEDEQQGEAKDSSLRTQGPIPMGMFPWETALSSAANTMFSSSNTSHSQSSSYHTSSNTSHSQSSSYHTDDSHSGYQGSASGHSGDQGSASDADGSNSGSGNSPPQELFPPRGNSARGAR